MQAFQGDGLGPVPCGGLYGDTRSKDSAEVSDSQQEHKQHGEDEREFDHRLTAMVAHRTQPSAVA
jgi:hypothetical protein